MKRRQPWFVAVLVLIVALVAAFFRFSGDRITANSYKLIRLGMTEKQVESILGEPGKTKEGYLAYKAAIGNNPKHPIKEEVLMEPAGGWFFVQGETTKYWVSHRAEVEILFDAQGAVVFKRLS